MQSLILIILVVAKKTVRVKFLAHMDNQPSGQPNTPLHAHIFHASQKGQHLLTVASWSFEIKEVTNTKLLKVVYSINYIFLLKVVYSFNYIFLSRENNLNYSLLMIMKINYTIMY